MSDIDATVKAAYEVLSNANDRMEQEWLEQIVFSWQWWVVFGLTIIPWIFQILFRKRNVHGVCYVRDSPSSSCRHGGTLSGFLQGLDIISGK